MFNPFQTGFGVVRFLICLGTWLCWNKWCTMKSYDRARMSEHSLEIWSSRYTHSLRGKSVSATVLYFRIVSKNLYTDIATASSIAVNSCSCCIDHVSFKRQGDLNGKNNAIKCVSQFLHWDKTLV